MVKLWTGASWAWVKLRVKGRKLPPNVDILSPILCKKNAKLFLHVPVAKKKGEFTRPKKAVEQRENEALKICSVDLNINDDLAVCVVQKADGTVEATKFIRGGNYLQHRRKKLLGTIATKRAKTSGTGTKGVSSNTCLWRKIRRIDDNEAHRVSRRIIDFALSCNATIIVFEHLGSFKPKRGAYSKKGNDKRSYWLRGKIFKYTKYKAFELQLLTSRVSPAHTSRRCSNCHEDVFRFGKELDCNNPYRPGAPNFLCPYCQNRGNANRMAAINVGRKFFARRFEKPEAKASGALAFYEGASHGR